MDFGASPKTNQAGSHEAVGSAEGLGNQQTVPFVDDELGRDRFEVEVHARGRQGHELGGARSPGRREHECLVRVRRAPRFSFLGSLDPTSILKDGGGADTAAYVRNVVRWGCLVENDRGAPGSPARQHED